MYDFLKDNYFIPLYGITLLISLLRYNRYYSSILKYFPLIIIYTMVSEILGFFIRDFDDFQIVYIEKYQYANYIIFNIYDLVFFFYFYFIFWKVVKRKKHKDIIKYGALVYIVASLINPFIHNVLIFPQFYASTIGSIVLIIAIFLYFREGGIQKGNRHNLLTWISYGLLIFNIFFPVISLLSYYNFPIYDKLYLRQFHYLLIIATYVFFIIGFVLMKPMRALAEES
ncbi:hypothetical protein HPE56_09455 [Maribacter sp. ANRC-HE7]|uniref:Histidine kinase N-terminal 7TM region domain-containing protein n=1 Tax=Maribacter aquimaris TaxID=2737171 RepID=A0ABR7UZJ8_9FLAO|nr:hypothetical protein [Maribacter aquimaris]MBD0778020.1 hypothetical protein [Maribacter aquimaris]